MVQVLAQSERASRIYQCERCGKSFKTHNGLGGHVNVVHRIQWKPCSCPVCSKEFTDQRRLGAHFEGVHTEKGRARVQEWCRTGRETRNKHIAEEQKNKPIPIQLTPEEKGQIRSLATKRSWDNPIIRAKRSQKIKEAKAANLHDKYTLEEMANLQEQGYRCIPLGLRKFPKPDIIAVNMANNKVYAVEIERQRAHPETYDTYNWEQYFNDIHWIIRKRR